MPWFPIRGVIRKLRIERRWTREELARKAGVKPRTVRLWESDDIPRTGHDDTVRGFAHAFAVKNVGGRVKARKFGLEAGEGSGGLLGTA